MNEHQYVCNADAKCKCKASQSANEMKRGEKEPTHWPGKGWRAAAMLQLLSSSIVSNAHDSAEEIIHKNMSSCVLGSSVCHHKTRAPRAEFAFFAELKKISS
eukprot:scaffold391_cov88-Skeletonema_dohrnii-CCMP3373.AAC.10